MADDELNDGAARVRIRGSAPWAGWSLVPTLGVFWALFCSAAVLSVPYFMARRDISIWETLWHEDTSGAVWMALVVSAPYFAVIVWVVREHIRRRTVREVTVNRKGLTLTRYRMGWRPARTWSVDWDQVKYVSAWRGWFGEAAPSRHNSRRVLRPGLDVYLCSEVDEDDRWVYSENRRSQAPEPADGPSPWVRIGAPGYNAQENMVRFTQELGRIRPDVFYRGTDLEQWYTPPGVAPETPPDLPTTPSTTPAPADSTDSAAERPVQPNVPIVLGFETNFRQVIALSGVLATGTALSALGVRSDLWYPLVGGLSGLGLVLFGIPLLFGVWFSPHYFARKEVRVTPRGLEFEPRPLLWSRQGLEACIPWTRVQAVTHRTITGAANHRPKDLRNVNAPVLHDHYSVIEIYTEPFNPGDPKAWAHLLFDVDQCPKPDTPALNALAEFPATRLQLRFTEDLVGQTAAEWQEMDDGGPVPTTVSLWQLGRAVQIFRPDLCHGFDRLGASASGRREKN